MARTTTINGFSVPQLSDPANIEIAVGTFADAIDTNVNARFANATARNTAIPSPIGGMVTYRSDQNALEMYDGTNWVLLNGIELGIANAGAADSTTVTSYANLAGTSSFAFTKKSTGTQLKINLHATFYVLTASADTRFGVLINGVDYDVAQLSGTVNTAIRMTASGTRLLTGIAPGAYTIQGRWKRVAGSGTCTRDTSDWLAITCIEQP